MIKLILNGYHKDSFCVFRGYNDMTLYTYTSDLTSKWNGNLYSSRKPASYAILCAINWNFFILTRDFQTFPHQTSNLIFCDGSEMDSGSLRIDYKAFKKKKRKCYKKKANRKQFQQHLFPAFPLFFHLSCCGWKSNSATISEYKCLLAFKLLNSNYLDCEKSRYSWE